VASQDIWWIIKNKRSLFWAIVFALCECIAWGNVKIRGIIILGYSPISVLPGAPQNGRCAEGECNSVNRLHPNRLLPSVVLRMKQKTGSKQIFYSSSFDVTSCGSPGLAGTDATRNLFFILLNSLIAVCPGIDRKNKRRSISPGVH